MARVEETRTTTYVDRTDEPVQRQDESVQSGTSLATRIVQLIGSIIIGLLALRFVFSLLGANRDAPIADFVYTLSTPFLVPFFGLFNYDPQFGVSRFEFETLVAIVFYAILTAVIARIIGLGNRR